MLDIQVYKKIKVLMRNKVFFIDMDRAIEGEINICIASQSTGRPTPPVKIQPSTLTMKFWTY